ncbi:MAG: GAF domain-containing protein [Planctomycetaceae bacterium]|nr:GAF domain-containing protein [Planctomycetaceae bacterium]
MSQDSFEKHWNSIPLSVTVVEEEPAFCLASLPELAQAFQKVTGYQLRFLKRGVGTADCIATYPISLGDNTTCMMGLVRNLTSVSLIPEREVESLTRAIADMISEAYQWQIALRQREAELAANVQLTFHDQDHCGLAHQLEHILRCGAAAVHCDATALYLLDHETSLLKLRSIWGLPEERLIDPPRPLAAALADLEAMLGHVVTLNEGEFFAERWNAPEHFPAAICVPVASSTTIHGTLWCFANARVDFDRTAVSLLEVVAGRIAMELERKMLLREGHDGMILKRQLTDAEHFLQNQLPRARVKSGDPWQIAGAMCHSKPLAATFYDWQTIAPEKSLCTIVSTAEKMPSVEAQMRMVMLQTEIKNLGRYKRSAKQAVRELEDIAFSQQAEKKPFQMMYGLLDKSKSELQLSLSGSFLLFRYQACNIDKGDRPEICRIDRDFQQAKPELGGYRTLSMETQDCLIAVHLPEEAHHRNDRFLNALYSRTFLKDKLMPAMNADAARIAELFAAHTQETISGVNVTILVVKRDGVA